MRRGIKRLIALTMTLVMMLPISSVVGFGAEAEESAVVTQSEAVALEGPEVTWRLADPTNIQYGRNYLIVSAYGALINTMAIIPNPVAGMEYVPGMAVAPVTIEGNQVVSEVTPGMIWQFGPGTNNAAPVDGLGVGAGFLIRNNAPGEGAGLNPLRREPSHNLLAAPLNTTNAVLNANQQSVMLYVLDAETSTVSLFYYGGIGGAAWSFAITGRSDGFTNIGGTFPTVAGLRALLATAPLRLYEEYLPGDWHSIISSSGPNGTISPTTITGHVWVEAGEDITFEFTPVFGYQVDVVTVDGEPVAVTDNSFTFTDVSANHTIHVTFRPLEGATEIPFIVWNDNFASGEFTTAVIIDLGEGNEAIAAELDKANFSVAATNTRLVGGAVAFDGTRNITRVYTNTEPRLLGYVGQGRNHPDPLPQTPATGRYIIVELEFWTLAGGHNTLDFSNSTVQNYRVNHNGPIALVGDDNDIEVMFFTQQDAGTTGVRALNLVLDQFRPGPVMEGLPVIGGTHYIHRDENGAPVKNLPLYIYFHGGGRGTDAFSPLRSQNGAAALAARVMEDPDRWASHIFAPTGGQNWANWNTVIQAMIDEGWVDPRRIYVSGFSGGGNSTHAFARNLPHFPAAIVPIAPARGFFTENEVLNIPGLADISYWILVHRFDNGGGGGGVPGCYPGAAIFFGLDGHGTVYHHDPMTNMATWNAAGHMRYARLTVFRNNDTFVWPYDQWTPEQSPPYGATDWPAHESEAPVLFNSLADMARFNYWPNNLPGEDHPSYPDYRAELLRLAEIYDDVLDWMFAQVRGDGDRLIAIPAVAPVDGIPYGRPVSPANPPNAVWTLGNFLPSQIPIMTTDGRIMADVNWVIDTTAIPPEMYSPARFVPQTFNVNGTVVLPAGIENSDDISLAVTIQVTVDGGKRVDVPWTAVRPDIDSGWDNATTIFVQDYIRRTVAHPGMPEDPFAPTATAEADILWGNENLYVRIRVTDDNISTSGANHTVDGAEVFLSEAGFRGAQSALQAHQMNQYRVSSTGAATFRWNSAQSAMIINEAWRRVARETDTGYEVFVAIPLLYNNGPTEGTTMLMDIMLNDATLPAGTRTAEISWNDPSWGGFSNSNGWGEITLVRDGDARHSIVATTGPNGSISPTSLAGRVWVDHGASQTFTVTPAFGFVVDTATVNGEPVTLTNNTFTFTNVTTADNNIHVTFKPAEDAVELPFIVWNDNFPAGEFTTAVIIDVGEGNEAIAAELDKANFAVAATNTRLVGGAVAFDGARNITRVYTNTEPRVLGYVGPGRNHPDPLPPTPATGRYIIVELEFWTLGGGLSTLDASNSTVQNYRVNHNGPIPLTGANPDIELMYFTQLDAGNTGVRAVNEVLDQFRPGPVMEGLPVIGGTHYIHRDENGNPVMNLPLYIYFHGGGRGTDAFSPLRSQNGAAALATRIFNGDERFASHIFAPTGGQNWANWNTVIQAMIDEGWVDPRRIYISGFSGGGNSTHAFARNLPHLPAALVPIGPARGFFTESEVLNIPGLSDISYWVLVHRFDDGGGGGGVPGCYPGTAIFFGLYGHGTVYHFDPMTNMATWNAASHMRYARITVFRNNDTFAWPMNQWTPEQAPPYGATGWAAHESEAPVLFNTLLDMAYFNYWPNNLPGEDHPSYPDYRAELLRLAEYYDDVFAWIFAQVRQVEGDENLVRIPAIAPIDGIPYGRPVAPAAGPNAVWTLGNFLPRQIPIVTTDGRVMADVSWVINTTAIPPEMYSPARFEPQTFNVSGTVTLPYGVTNTDDVSLEVTIQVTVDGGKRADIPWTAERPNIDGGWNNATTIFIEDYIRRTAAHPGMPGDPFAPTATAEADILWGDENLYLRIRVTDDNISTSGANHTVDGAEVFLSEAAFRGAQSGAQAHQMNQYRLSSTGAVSFRWNSSQTAMIGNDEWRRVARKTDFGYELFLAIPLLYNNGPVEGQTMLLDIQLNDATLPAGTRTAEISWNDPSWGGFSNSNGWGEITLVREGDARHSIVATTGHNGSISPTSLAGRVWVNHGADQTFTVIPAFGYEVDTATVNGEAVTLTDNAFTFTNVTTADNSIHVTFRRSVDATSLDFIVYNDVFPAGEFTTAVIIDLGEGRTANLADLNPSMFTVAARNTRIDGTTVTFDGTRTISRVYVNTEPAILGYSSPAPGSPDLVVDTPTSGRYIIVELVFWGPTGGYAYGGSTADGSNSTIQNYRINMAAPLPLAGGTALTAVFNQVDVVSPVNQFAISQAGNVPMTVFINENEDLYPLPVFIYIHGGGRGGPAVDRFAAHRTANGGTLLSTPRKQEQFPSHIIVPQGSFIFNGFGGGGETQAHRDNRAALIAYVNEMVAAGLADPSRIYMSGFSDGGFATMEFVRHHPDFLAVAVPMAGGNRLNAEQVEAASEVAIWPIINRADGGTATAWFDFLNTGLGSTESWAVRNAGTILQTNLVRDSWPHTGFTWTPHEVEATVFGQNIGDLDALLAVGSAQAEFADRNIFDWIFAQRRGQEDELTLTFHLYTANQVILDAFGDYATAEVDGRPVILVTVVPGTAATTWAGMEYALGLGHIYGTANQHGYAFWGWFDDELLDESGRTGDGLRRPALTLGGESMCVLADLLDQLANATMEEALELFDDGNIDLYGVWVRFGDVDDSSLVNMADLQLLQRHVNFSHVLPVNFSGPAADVVVDGLVNMTDLSLLQRFTNFSHIIAVVLGERPQ